MRYDKSRLRPLGDCLKPRDSSLKQPLDLESLFLDGWLNWKPALEASVQL